MSMRDYLSERDFDEKEQKAKMMPGFLSERDFDEKCGKRGRCEAA